MDDLQTDAAYPESPRLVAIANVEVDPAPLHASSGVHDGVNALVPPIAGRNDSHDGTEGQHCRIRSKDAFAGSPAGPGDPVITVRSGREAKFRVSSYGDGRASLYRKAQQHDGDRSTRGA